MHKDDGLLVPILLPGDRHIVSEVVPVSELLVQDTRYIIPFPPDPVTYGQFTLDDEAYHVVRVVVDGIVLRL